jgi:hypothetical protein
VIRFFSLSVLCAAALLGGCSEPRDDAKARLKTVNAAELRTDAARIYKQLYASPGADYVPLKPSLWPASFKKLKPLRVGVYPNGFALAIEGSGELETGLHVVPLGLTATPTSSHAKYEQLQEGVYWYVHRQKPPGN